MKEEDFDRIAAVLCDRGESPQLNDRIPDVGAEATTEFFRRFEGFTYLLGREAFDGWSAEEFASLLNDPSPSDVYTLSYVEGEVGDLSGVRVLAVDRVSLLVDAHDPEGQLFVPGLDDWDAETDYVYARATGVTLWGWLDRFAQLAISHNVGDITEDFPAYSELLEATSWFDRPNAIWSRLNPEEIAEGLVGGGRFALNLPRMSDPRWVNKTFGLSPEWVQLNVLDGLALVADSHPDLARRHLELIVSSSTGEYSDVVDTRARQRLQSLTSG